MTTDFGHAAIAQGFSAALIIPAIASTLKQAQRESADDLHTLANYYSRNGAGSDVLDTVTRRAARRFGVVLVEQGVNGSTFFLVVQFAVMGGGVLGGILAQVAITGNTIITPQQTQKFNPAKLLFGAIGTEPDWVSYLPGAALRQFAFFAGGFATFCGYGDMARNAAIPGRRGVGLLQFSVG